MRSALLAALSVVLVACSTDPPPPDAWLSEYSLQGADCPACPTGSDGHVCDLGPHADGGTRFLAPDECVHRMACGNPPLPAMGGYYCPHPEFDRCRSTRCLPCAYDALVEIACNGRTFTR